MAFITGTDKFQCQFSDTFSFDDLIDPNNPVRAISAFVDSLDLAQLGFKLYSPNKPGQKPYDVRVLLAIHIYCFFNNIKSARKQELECSRNIDLIWLTSHLTPCFSTISSFYRNNLQPIKNVFHQFTLLCKDLQLFDFKIWAIDGTKIKAFCSKKSAFTKKSLADSISYIDQLIVSYSSSIDDMSSSSPNNLSKKLDSIKDRRAKYVKLLDEMNSNNIDELCLTDSDSKLMKNHGSIEPCYNMQSVVDSKNHLILDFDVSNHANDVGLLKPMIDKTLSDLDLTPSSSVEFSSSSSDNTIFDLKVLADTGYYKESDLLDIFNNHITPLVPKPKTSNSTGNPNFSKDNFSYDISSDSYICPFKKSLPFKRLSKETRNGISKYYKIYNNSSVCTSCPHFKTCTNSHNGRSIKRNVDEDTLSLLQDTYKSDNHSAYKLRKALVEHPFGSIKFYSGFNNVFLKGREKVSSWFASVCLVYNFKRVINIVRCSKINRGIIL